VTTNWNIDQQTRGVNGFALRFCDTVYTASLGANTRLTVPGEGGMGLPGANNNRYIALICTEPASAVYMTIGAPGSTPTAAVPAGVNFAASNSVLIPASSLYAVNVYAGQVMAFISAAAGADVCVSFFAIQDT
jgi:hypothetical protein